MTLYGKALMYRNILLAIDLNDETSCRKPLLSAVELAHTFSARLHVLTVVREVEANPGGKGGEDRLRGHRLGSTEPDRCPDPSGQCVRPQAQRSRHAWRQHLCRDFGSRRGSRG